MNPDNFVQLAQKGLRVTLGATASFIETLQDPQRREESVSRLKTEFSQLAEEWEVKGEFTEREARNFVDSLLNQRMNRDRPPSPPPTSAPTSSTSSTASDRTAPEIQQDLQDLTSQLAALRTELERLREQDS